MYKETRVILKLQFKMAVISLFQVGLSPFRWFHHESQIVLILKITFQFIGSRLKERMHCIDKIHVRKFE